MKTFLSVLIIFWFSVIAVFGLLFLPLLFKFIVSTLKKRKDKKRRGWRRKMKTRPVMEEHYGAQVWVNPIIEKSRREECLCLNCGRIKNCEAALELYTLCQNEDIALAVTRCPRWEEKKG